MLRWCGLFVAAAVLMLALTAPTALGAANPVCTPTLKVGPPQERKVCSPDELRQLLASPFTGRIIIPRDVDWNLKSGPQEGTLFVHSNVQIVGERGDLASRPTLRATFQPTTSQDDDKYSLFEIDGSNVRIEHIHFVGPKKASTHPRTEPYVQGITVVENDEVTPPEPQWGRNVLITDSEFELWSGSGVEVQGPDDHGDAKRPEDYKPGWKHRTWKDVGEVQITNSYLHHNVMHNGGYGVVIGAGGYATITGNVFDTNRHAVASNGRAYEGYKAQFNYVLEGGYKQGHYYNQHFDVHGIGDGGYGGSAGTHFDISFNTVRGEQDYYCAVHCFGTRPVIMLRGRPSEGMFFHDNVLVHDDAGEAVTLKGLGISAGSGAYNFHNGGNVYDADYTRQIGSGDFDGDGRTDVFLATGTGWFFSRAGVRPWELLHISGRVKEDLGLADIDNDGRTDVLFQDGNRIGFLKSGTAAPVFLTSAPVKIKDVRFGDFDGDGKTDMFYTRNKQWRIWYGRNHHWSDAQTSVSPISELIFGEFDGVKGTDVAAVKNQGWSLSSAGQGSYTKFNGKLTDSFASARGVDVDGNGKTDVVFSDGRWSRDGRGKLERLFNTGSSLANWVTGHFDGQPRNEVITWDSAGLNLTIARVPDRKTFVRQSVQPMR